jgi:hypothetical protein
VSAKPGQLLVARFLCSALAYLRAFLDDDCSMKDYAPVFMQNIAKFCSSNGASSSLFLAFWMALLTWLVLRTAPGCAP